MHKSFNLLKEQWLPCIDEHNQMVSHNILDVITHAHTLKEIQGGLSIITGALYLFLIAFIKNVLDLQNEDEWEELWKIGRFPQDVFLQYANKWEDRFDLFDPSHPFYQDSCIGQREKDIKMLPAGKAAEPKGISGLLMHLASGNNATLFDHSLDGLPSWYSPAEAAQLLITWQAYSLCGMSSASISSDRFYKDSPFTRGILFLNIGTNLFQTIMLNIASFDFDTLQSTKIDKPCWEMDDPHVTNRFDPKGILDFLTWQSRRILLIPEENYGEIGVRSLFIAPGHGLVETFCNPFFYNRIQQTNGKQIIRPMRFRQGYALWRDSSAILNKMTFNLEAPLPIKWSAYLQNRGILQIDTIQMNLLGMCIASAPKKTVYFYAQETFSAPTAYLEEDKLWLKLEQGLQWAEQVRSNLYLAVRDLASFYIEPNQDLDNGHEPSNKQIKDLMQHWNTEQHYWGMLEPAFYEYLGSLPKSETAQERWKNAIRKAARAALNISADQVGTAPAGLKARAKAERSLNRLMYKTFNPEELE